MRPTPPTSTLIFTATLFTPLSPTTAPSYRNGSLRWSQSIATAFTTLSSDLTSSGAFPSAASQTQWPPYNYASAAVVLSTKSFTPRVPPFLSPGFSQTLTILSWVSVSNLTWKSLNKIMGLGEMLMQGFGGGCVW